LYSRAESIGFRTAITEQRIGGKGLAIYTEEFGSRLTEPFRKAIMSTIRMIREMTIGLRIWSVCLEVTTSHCIVRKASGLVARLTRNSFVRKNTRRPIQHDPSIATKIVKLERLDVEDVKVYDLTVEHDHCYYANGLLVSNSDAFRYGAIKQKEVHLQTQHDKGELISSAFNKFSAI